MLGSAVAVQQSGFKDRSAGPASQPSTVPGREKQNYVVTRVRTPHLVLREVPCHGGGGGLLVSGRLQPQLGHGSSGGVALGGAGAGGRHVTCTGFIRGCRVLRVCCTEDLPHACK